MRIFLTLTFVFLCIQLTAQEKISEQHVGWRGGGVQLYTISNQDISCSFMLALDSIKAIVMDNNANIIQSFSVHRRGPAEKFLGGFIRNGRVNLFMDNGENPGLHIWSLNIADRSIKENILPFKIKKDKVITQLSTDNHFFFFTINKNSSEFVIYDFSDEINFDTTHYPAEAEMWDRIRKNTVSLEPGFDIVTVNMEGEADIETAKCPNKIYTRNDSLILLCDGPGSITIVYEFDLAHKKMGSRRILHNPKNLDRGAEVDNSFLLGHNLYYVAATTETLVLQAVDFYTGAILKEFYASADSGISFKNTPIIQEGGALGGSRELDKTKQLLRKMTRGDAVIIAYSDITDNQVRLLVGSYIFQPATYSPYGFSGS